MDSVLESILERFGFLREEKIREEKIREDKGRKWKPKRLALWGAKGEFFSLPGIGFLSLGMIASGEKT